MTDQLAGTAIVHGERSRRDVLRETLGILRKQIWYSLLFFALVVSGVALWTFRQTPKYEASATLIIDTQPPRVFANLHEVVELGTGSFWSNKEYYETQYKVIASRSIAERVVERLELDTDPVFLGRPVQAPADGKAAEPGPDAVDLVRTGLQVEPLPDTRVVRLKYRHSVAEMAQKVVNTVARVYQEANLDYRNVATVDANRELGTQLREAKGKLEDSEDRLARFKQENGIIISNIDTQLNIIADKLQTTSAALNATESEREKLEARLGRIRSMNLEKDWGSLDEVLASPLLARLKESYLKLNQEKIQLSVDFLEKHPRMKTVDDQLTLVRKSIDDEVHLIISSLERNLAALQDTEAATRARLRKVEDEARRLEGLRNTFERLKREAQENGSLYEMVVARLRETSLTGQVDSNNIRILDLALLPTTPVAPRTRLNLAMALLFGLLGGIGFALLMEYLDRSIRSREEVEAFGIPFLGIAPEVKEKGKAGEKEEGKKGKGKDKDKVVAPDLYILKHPRSSAAESVRLVRTNLLFANPGGEVSRLVVSSASPREGKTHTALNIAISMAQSGKRTLLIDSDMRRPRLHKVFGVENIAGLSNLIVGKARADEVVLETGVDNLSFLPCGPLPPNPAELLQTEQLKALLRELGSTYERLILDSPPIMAVADPLILSQLTDGVILVIRSNVSTRDVVFRSVQALRDVNARILGAVLNGVDLTKPYYGKYYHYYRRGYGSGYHSDDTAEDRGIA